MVNLFGHAAYECRRKKKGINLLYVLHPAHVPQEIPTNLKEEQCDT